jgi:hypothetical protein
MNTYTHAILAKRLETLFQPEQTGAYYWGAVVPDIRYLCGFPRDRTHLSRAAVLEMESRYPQLKSFLQGYRVHCLLDEINLTQVLCQALPLRLFGRRLSNRISLQQAAVLVELYYLKQPQQILPFVGGPNDVLTELGISVEDAQTFANGISDYLSAPSITTALTTFDRLGFIRSGRGETYIRAARSLERNWPLKALLLWSVKNIHLERKAENHVRSALLKIER